MLPRGLLRRQLCTATGPRLPRWGSFGKTQEQLEKTVAQISEVNERQVCTAPVLGRQRSPPTHVAWPSQVSITRDLADFGLRFAATVIPSRMWFDPEARASFREGADAELERYARCANRCACSGVVLAAAGRGPAWLEKREGVIVAPRLGTVGSRRLS